MNYDITFCSYKKCKNKDCERHRDSIKDWFHPVSIGDFPNCENWKDGNHSIISQIRRMAGD